MARQRTLQAATTRRELLQRGGLLAGVLALGPLAPRALASATAAPVGLREERRRVFAALADTVVTGPTMLLPAAAGARAVSDFESVYANWPVSEQRRADKILDALGRSFATRGRAGREAVLHPVSGGSRAAELAAQAWSLASVAIGPGDDELARAEVAA
jgi:hypothetical protein